MDRLERIRFTTENLFFLQGLKVLPGALVCLANAAWIAWVGNGPFARSTVLWVLPLNNVVALAGFWLGALYYRRLIGEVKPSAQTQRRIALALAPAAVAGAVLGYLAGRFSVSGNFGALSCGVALAFSLGSFGYWTLSKRVLNHYLYAVGPWLVFAGLELFVGPLCAHGLGLHGWRAMAVDLLGAFGVYGALMALADHLALMRSFGPPVAASEEAA
jgi:hypothetical protein